MVVVHLREVLFVASWLLLYPTDGFTQSQLHSRYSQATHEVPAVPDRHSKRPFSHLYSAPVPEANGQEDLSLRVEDVTASPNGNSLTAPEADSFGSATPPCVIKILGVGGGGGNAVNRMIQTRIDGVTFWAINTDAQALAKSLAPNILNIGRQLTRGLGAGGEPDTGAEAAKENAQEIHQICEGADMVFITAGMGGGTGSGAAPVVAEIAKSQCNCLTVGVVTKPFAFEGRRRLKQAEKAIEKLRSEVDTLVVVSNDKLLQIVPPDTPVTDAFLVADDILRQGVVGISEIILKTGLVNVDFADVRSVMKEAGTALMGVGTGDGRTRAVDAAVAAISSPLLDAPIKKAKRIVFNIVGGEDLGLKEINEASEVIYQNADEDANIIFGALVDTSMGSEVSITVLACDFDVITSSQILSFNDKEEAPAAVERHLNDEDLPPTIKRAFNKPKVVIEQEERSTRGRLKRLFGKVTGRSG